MPPFATPRNPYDSICPRFVHSSTNKTRAPVNVVHWFPHGRRLLSGTQTGEMTIWNGFQFHFENILQAHNASLRAMQWTPEENILVSGDQLGIIKFWDQYIYNFQTFQAHKESICDITIAPTGMKFCSCADDSHAKVWDLRTGEEERAFTGHGWDVKCCNWHPTKGLVATGSKDSQIKLWDPRASEAITTIYCHNNTVTKVAWSPNGQFLASGSRDQLIMLMDIRTMSVRKVFKGHQKEVTSLCWHPESEALLASGGHDAALHFWDTYGASTPSESVPGAHEGPIWSLSWHPLGHLLVSGSNDYSTRFWSRARPGDKSFVDLLPKKIALGANEAPVTVPDALHVGTVFASGIFAEPPLPPAPPEVKQAAVNGQSDTPTQPADKPKVPEKPTPGLSIGEGANRKDVLDTSDFDAEDTGGRQLAPPQVAIDSKRANSAIAAPTPGFAQAEPKKPAAAEQQQSNADSLIDSGTLGDCRVAEQNVPGSMGQESSASTLVMVAPVATGAVAASPTVTGTCVVGADAGGLGQSNESLLAPRTEGKDGIEAAVSPLSVAPAASPVGQSVVLAAAAEEAAGPAVEAGPGQEEALLSAKRGLEASDAEGAGVKRPRMEGTASTSLESTADA